MNTLTFEATIERAIEDVWKVLATVEGIKTYLSPNIRVEPEVGGAFEIYFDMSQAEGLRGSEGMKVLSVEAPTRFAFTWNNPPSLPAIRGQQTAVFISLEDFGGSTKFTLDHTGFGDGKDWQTSYGYFMRAWGQIVIPRFIYAVEQGSYPWGEDLDLTVFAERVKTNYK